MDNNKSFLEDDLSFDPFNNVPKNELTSNNSYNQNSADNTDVNNGSIDSRVFTGSGNFQRIAIDGEKSRALEERIRAAQPKPSGSQKVSVPREPLREIGAFIVATIAFWFGALFYIMTFNMEYAFNLQMVTIIFPLLFLYGGFIWVNKQINCIEIIILMILFVVMSHCMFQVTLAHAMSKISDYGILEMLQIVKNRSQIKEITELYNFHFIPMYGFLAILCVITVAVVYSIQKDKREKGGR